jgi:hypothetical protein
MQDAPLTVKRKRERIIVSTTADKARKTWSQVPFRNKWLLKSPIDAEEHLPIASVEYEGKDTWVIKILGVRETGRRGTIDDLGKIQSIAETMLWSTTRKILDFIN